MSRQNGFTDNPDLYRTSLAHAEVPDLEECLDDLPGLSGLSVLDVATGSGHTAFFFARKGCHTFAVDINKEMLKVAEEESDRQTLSIRFLWSSAEDLNFDDEAFDLVTCRLATHHFEDIPKFLSEAHRVLRPGGTLLIIDNVVPENDSSAAEWMNDYEKKRDTSHQACLSPERWKTLFETEGFGQLKSSRFKKTLLFDPWMKRMSKSDEESESLWNELLQAPQEVRSYWKPKLNSSRERTLRLHREIMIYKK